MDNFGKTFCFLENAEKFQMHGFFDFFKAQQAFLDRGIGGFGKKVRKNIREIFAENDGDIESRKEKIENALIHLARTCNSLTAHDPVHNALTSAWWTREVNYLEFFFLTHSHAKLFLANFFVLVNLVSSNFVFSRPI